MEGEEVRMLLVMVKLKETKIRANIHCLCSENMEFKVILSIQDRREGIQRRRKKHIVEEGEGRMEVLLISVAN